MVSGKAENPRVGGSIPPLGTINFRTLSRSCQREAVAATSRILMMVPQWYQWFRKLAGSPMIPGQLNEFD
jgi:hypothetical protein